MIDNKILINKISDSREFSQEEKIYLLKVMALESLQNSYIEESENLQNFNENKLIDQQRDGTAKKLELRGEFDLMLEQMEYYQQHISKYDPTATTAKNRGLSPQIDEGIQAYLRFRKYYTDTDTFNENQKLRMNTLIQGWEGDQTDERLNKEINVLSTYVIANHNGLYDREVIPEDLFKKTVNYILQTSRNRGLKSSQLEKLSKIGFDKTHQVYPLGNAKNLKHDKEFYENYEKLKQFIHDFSVLPYGCLRERLHQWWQEQATHYKDLELSKMELLNELNFMEMVKNHIELNTQWFIDEIKNYKNQNGTFPYSLQIEAKKEHKILEDWLKKSYERIRNNNDNELKKLLQSMDLPIEAGALTWEVTWINSLKAISGFLKNEGYIPKSTRGSEEESKLYSWLNIQKFALAGYSNQDRGVRIISPAEIEQLKCTFIDSHPLGSKFWEEYMQNSNKTFLKNLNELKQQLETFGSNIPKTINDKFNSVYSFKEKYIPEILKIENQHDWYKNQCKELRNRDLL
jgi:hypothetical protein